MMTHPYKRSAFLAGAAALALAVPECGNEGDTSDVIQGSGNGTASAVSGGTTAATATTGTSTGSDTDSGHWLKAGETAKILADDPNSHVYMLRNGSTELGLTDYTPHELYPKDDKLCFDAVGHYEILSGDFSEPSDLSSQEGFKFKQAAEADLSNAGTFVGEDGPHREG